MATEYVNAYVDGGRVVRVRRAAGRASLDYARAEYSALFRRDEVEPKLRRHLEGSASVLGSKDEGDWLRVGWRDAETRKQLCSSASSPLAAIQSYEADVDPVRRWLTDTDVDIAAPARVYLDLETDSRKTFVQARNGEARILSWAVVDDTGRRRCGVLDEDTDAAEETLLRALWAQLDAYDQVVAWNGDGFDFPVLWLRSAERGVNVEPRRWLWLDMLLLFKRMNSQSAGSGAEKQSMKLEDIGQEIVGEGKLTEGGLIPGKALGAQTWEMWEAGGDYRARMVRYNVADTDLLRKIEKETGYIALFDTLCRVCRCFGNTASLNPTLQMDGFMLRLGRERGHHFISKRFYEGSEKFKGAYVMQPRTRGIARNVHVADFSAMYPSIILTFNMSPDTKRNIAVNGPILPGCARAPTTGIGFDVTLRGILVEALREMLRLRKYWSDKQAALPPGTPEWYEAGRISTAYKVAANSFYGVVGSPFSRYFDRSIAESVTQTGVWLIKQTAAEAEKRGWQVVYADTDSIFVVGCSRAEFETFVAWCNVELYPRIIAAQGCRENHIKIAYEKQFDRLVFVSAKRYIGSYVHYKGKAATADSKPEIKGLEYKRGDAGGLARRLQSEVIDMLVGGLGVATVPVPTETLEDFHGVLGRIQEHVLRGELATDDVFLSKSLSRPLKEYIVRPKKDGTAAAQPPHVTVAHVLKARGREIGEGTRVEYFVADGTTSPVRVLPAEDYAGECDRFHLWESNVYPPTGRLLAAAFPDHEWDAWGKVRPKVVRARKGAIDASQTSFLGALENVAASPTIGRRKKSVARGIISGEGANDAKAK